MPFVMHSSEAAASSSKGGEKHERLMESMRSHPSDFSAIIRRRMAEAMEKTEEECGHTLAMRFATEEIGVGTQRTLGYLLSAICHIHEQISRGRLDSAEALCLRTVAAVDQYTLDGNWGVAWETMGLRMPPFDRWKQVDLKDHRRQYPKSRLLEQRWISLAIAKLKEDEYLMKRRVGAGGGAAGGGKNDKHEKGGGKGDDA